MVKNIRCGISGLIFIKIGKWELNFLLIKNILNVVLMFCILNI